MSAKNPTPRSGGGDTLPTARDWLRSVHPEQEARAVKAQSLRPSAFAMTVTWHRRYAAAATLLQEELERRDVVGALPPQGEEDEIDESMAFAILSNTGQPSMQMVAMRTLDPEDTLRGSARLFLRNASPASVREWLGELAAWEDRWLAELAREEKPS